MIPHQLSLVLALCILSTRQKQCILSLELNILYTKEYVASLLD